MQSTISNAPRYFLAALDTERYDLLWDAMQDRLHQSYRQALIPGLAAALQMPRMPGLLGVALSGAGPSVIALATKNFAEIGKAMASHFARTGQARIDPKFGRGAKGNASYEGARKKVVRACSNLPARIRITSQT